jgi:uncharacterized membrane protein
MLAGCQEKTGDKLTPVTQTGKNAAAAPSISPDVNPSAPLVPPPPGSGTRFQALGTEPFWSVEVIDGGLRYSTPENLKGTDLSARLALEGSARIWTGTLEGAAFKLRIEPGTCSDGMSDTVYQWQAALTIGDAALQGCARAR